MKEDKENQCSQTKNLKFFYIVWVFIWLDNNNNDFKPSYIVVQVDNVEVNIQL